MRLPSPTEYNTAIQNPRLAFSDPELKTSKVELNPLGLPKVQSGGFALIYHLYNPKSHWAVRCFYRDVPDLRRRYDAISRFLEKNADGIFVDARLLHEGIRVSGQWYPIIKMPWLEGDPLNLYIERNLSRPAGISWLPSAFLELVRNLEKLQIAHGDLQHGNIMVVNNSLRLIDYDGLYLPELAGLPSNQIGHVNYQHPSRSEQHFDAKIDRFSEIVIYTALEALTVAPQLWRKYSDGENLLFKRGDFLDPENSPLLNELEKIPKLAPLARNFKSVCHLELDTIPSLEDFIAGRVPAPKMVPKVPKPVPRPPIIQYQFEIIDANDLAALLNRIGHRVQVVGQITDYHKDLTRYGKPYVFLNFGDWRKGCFTLVIWSEALNLFSGLGVQLSSYKGKWVSVTGVITSYQGRPQMEIAMPSQIQILHSAEEAELLLRKRGVAAIPMPAVPRTIKQPRVSTHLSREAAVLERLYGRYPSKPQPVTPPQPPMPTGMPTTSVQRRAIGRRMGLGLTSLGLIAWLIAIFNNALALAAVLGLPLILVGLYLLTKKP